MDKFIEQLEEIANDPQPFKVRPKLRAYIERLHLINAKKKEEAVATV